MVCTGYTAKLCEHGQTLQEFVMTCARAMGPLASMRDYPLDAPLPDHFDPEPIYARQLDDAQRNLSRLTQMSEDERIAEGERLKNDKVQGYLELQAKSDLQNARLNAMKQQVEAWEPPTPDHKPLKKFMLDQIKCSEAWSCAEELEQAQSMSPVEYFDRALTEARRQVSYSIKRHKKEIEQTNFCNEWLTELRNSVKGMA